MRFVCVGGILGTKVGALLGTKDCIGSSNKSSGVANWELLGSPDICTGTKVCTELLGSILVCTGTKNCTGTTPKNGPVPTGKKEQWLHWISPVLGTCFPQSYDVCVLRRLL